ncbi:MAG: YcaO-like family protein [bacterium]|jgi:ribosomal protein S12 methylthiotransferase accessory factor|nr:YcaO-like family protein [bacterium]
MARTFDGVRPPDPLVLDPVTGIVTFLAEGERYRSDPDIFVVAARSANLAQLHHLGINPPAEHHVTGSGAGLAYNDALGAAVGETVERYSFGIVDEEALCLATFQELCLKGELAIAPDRWALFHPSQKHSLPYTFFKNDTKIAWIKAQHLIHKRDYYVPACIVYSPYFGLMLDQGEQIIAPAISTGAACAFTRKEAMLKGLCEVVERDAFITLWRNRLPLPRVVIDEQSALYELYQEKFVRDGLEYAVFHSTLDLGIPSFFGVLINHRQSPPGNMDGGASHPDPNRAELKTLLELTQGFQWMNHVRQSDFVAKPDFSNVRSFDDRMHMYAFGDYRHHFDFLLDHGQRVPLSAITNIDQGGVATNFDMCCRMLAKNDINVLAIDLTPCDVAECGLAVVKVILPECSPMEGDHTVPFLGGERWNQVPVKVGLLDTARSLDEVNPAPHPYP